MLLAARLGLRFLVLYLKAGPRVRLATHAMPMALAFLTTAGSAAYLLLSDLGKPADWKLAAYPVAHALAIWGLWRATYPRTQPRGKHEQQGEG